MMWPAVIAVLLVTAMPIHAVIEVADISFVVREDFSVNETIAVAFDNPLDRPINYTLSEGVKSLIVMDRNKVLSHEIVLTQRGYVLVIYPEGDDTLYINFVSDHLIFSNNNIYQFFTELSFGEEAKKLEVKLVLPEGYGIYQNSYRPDSGEIGSRGREIEITWSFINLVEPVIFSVKFEKLSKEFNFLIMLPVFAVIAGAWLLFYRKYQEKLQKESERARHEFLLGFRDDERKVIEYLEKHRIAYQNKIEQEFKFSRAKMTRIVQKLAEKKLLHKQKKGRTNKLTWLKKE